MILPPNTKATYLAEGAFRLVYGLEADGAPLPYVLKVDNNVSRADIDSPKTYRPWDGAGCDREAWVYRLVKERALDLLHHLAAVHAHGPGWLIQERLPDVGSYSAVRIREIASAFEAQAGIRIGDLSEYNVGRREPGGDTVILDYACAYI